MRIDKVILRSALSTLAAIGVLFALLIAVMCFIFPQTMMQVTYDMGMDKLSVHFASVAYDRSGDAYYAAYATEVAIGADYDDQVEIFGEKLLSDDGFEAYASSRDENMPAEVTMSYCQYIQAQVCLAKYDQGKTDTVDKAFSYIGQTFEKNNAAEILLYEVLFNEDVTTGVEILQRLQTLIGQVPMAQVAYLQEVVDFTAAELQRLALNGN